MWRESPHRIRPGKPLLSTLEVRFLKSHELNVYSSTQFQVKAFHIACSYKTQDTAVYLAQKPGVLASTDTNGRTGAMFVAQDGDIEFLKLLWAANPTDFQPNLTDNVQSPCNLNLNCGFTFRGKTYLDTVMCCLKRSGWKFTVVLSTAWYGQRRSHSVACGRRRGEPAPSI